MQLEVLQRSRPWDLWIVQGDTESAFIGALTAFYARVPLLHVEAGLRTHDLRRPFPEEGIRQMISRIADLQCAPTARARAALLDEGVGPERILLTGNTVVDAQHWICERHGIRRPPEGRRGHVLVTAHRREHWGRDIEQIFRAVADIAHAHPQTQLLFPVHLNPVVSGPAHTLLAGIPNLRLLPPLDYPAMQRALAGAALLLTDSGGLQEEAPTFGVPTLVLREATERPEAVQAGCARLVGPVRADIVQAASRLLADATEADAMRRVANPFGDGHASERIRDAVHRTLGISSPDEAGALARRAAPHPARARSAGAFAPRHCDRSHAAAAIAAPLRRRTS